MITNKQKLSLRNHDHDLYSVALGLYSSSQRLNLYVSSPTSKILFEERLTVFTYYQRNNMSPLL